MISGTVVLVLLFAALLHAGWNAVVKSGADTGLTSALVAIFAGLAAAVLLLFVRPPAAASWSFIASSMVTQVTYYALVAAAYRAGEMSAVYPVMRGSAPLLVALLSGPLVGEPLSLRRWVGVLVLCAGVLSLALQSRGPGRLGPGVRLALLNAAVIATYTLIDGIGVRRSGSAVGYTCWVAIVTALPLLAWTAARRRAQIRNVGPRRLSAAAFGGCGTLASYGLALWAMTVAPVAAVAALRETSILFGTAISTIVLRERVGLARVLATVLIAAGAVVLRLSG